MSCNPTVLHGVTDALRDAGLEWVRVRALASTVEFPPEKILPQSTQAASHPRPCWIYGEAAEELPISDPWSDLLKVTRPV